MLTRLAAIPLACAAACAEHPCDRDHLDGCPAPPGGADSAEPSLPSFTPPSAEAGYTPEALAAAFAGALAAGGPEPRRPRDVYLELMALGDQTCPGDPEQIVGLVLGCTAASGWTYSGVTEYLPAAKEGREGWLLTADAAIYGPDGEIWLAGGHVALGRQAAGADAWYWGGEIQGSWTWDGEAGWLAPGVSAKMRVEGYRDADAFSFAVEGGVAFGGVEVTFDALTLDAACPGGAQGVMSLRDPSGGWWRAEFEEACATCAALSFEGAPAGSPLCLDFEPLYATYADLEIP